MKFESKDPPRTFRVGADESIELSDCGSVFLQPNEQITFRTESGTELDVAKKEWGYYATPSLNGRLKDHNLRAVLVKCESSTRIYLLLVEAGKEGEFQAYAEWDKLQVITWLDTDEAVEAFYNKLCT